MKSDKYKPIGERGRVKVTVQANGKEVKLSVDETTPLNELMSKIHAMLEGIGVK